VTILSLSATINKKKTSFYELGSGGGAGEFIQRADTWVRPPEGSV